MKKSRLLLIATLGSMSLGGCATARFSPPSTNIVNEMEVRGANGTFSKASCNAYEKLTDPNDTGSAKFPISPDAQGAITLANNFIYEFRCASHSAANSRQAFEIPGMLAGIGAATALALGAGTDVAIGGAAATSLADGSKDYYAPLTKAAIYGSALDAFLCIKSTAVGVQPFMISAQKAVGDEPKSTMAKRTGSAMGDGHFAPQRRFYELISSALFTTERIAASRLRNSARYDPAGVIAQLKDKLEEIEEAKSIENTDENKRLANEIVDGPKPVATSQKDADGNPVIQNQTRRPEDKAEDAVAVADTLNQMDILKPQLELCVLRAEL